MTVQELITTPLWHLAGWTMLHFLWTGALVGLAAGVLRLALQRFAPQLRYATMLATLATLALLPIVIGCVIHQANPVSIRGHAQVLPTDTALPQPDGHTVREPGKAVAPLPVRTEQAGLPGAIVEQEAVLQQAGAPVQNPPPSRRAGTGEA